jgi:hypothetical protein
MSCQANTKARKFRLGGVETGVVLVKVVVNDVIGETEAG